MNKRPKSSTTPRDTHNARMLRVFDQLAYTFRHLDIATLVQLSAYQDETDLPAGETDVVEGVVMRTYKTTG
ncbi:MAG: hypothetical protein AAFS10_01050 [Myxococcota bacterium]